MAIDLHTERLLRDLAPQVLGVVLRKFPDFPAAAIDEGIAAAAARTASVPERNYLATRASMLAPTG